MIRSPEYFLNNVEYFYKSIPANKIYYHTYILFTNLNLPSVYL